MTALPIRAMVLYKHGVGSFVRAGAVSGTAAALTFKSEEINDVLKSLTVFDQSGGQVLGIHYPTPIPQHERLATSSIKLSDQVAMRELLSQLRGRHITVTAIVGYEQPETVTATGRVVGIDTPLSNGYPTDNGHTRLLILTDTGVKVFRFDEVTEFSIPDEAAAKDLTYFLDTTSGDENLRTITIQLSDGDHHLVAQYIAPSPLWRVTYRLVADLDDKGAIKGALLQGWGVFDNRFEEDLTGVTLTLVAGQPISFIYDLSESQIPPRPVIRDEARVAPGPVEYGGAIEEMSGEAKKLSDATLEDLAKAAGRDVQGLIPPAGFAKAVRGAATPQAEGKETGETFQYLVKTPVTVKRGESALVPLFNADVQPARELLYNEAKLPKHPVAALRFKNTTGLTLERGPVTLMEGNAASSDYKGEAIIPFTKSDTDVYVPYAVELGVTITEQQESRVHTIGLIFKDSVLQQQQYSQYVRTYTLENSLNKPVTVLIEQEKNPEHVLHDTRLPDVETASHRRWAVPVAAKTRTTLVITQRRLFSAYQQIRNWDLKLLASYLENKWIDAVLESKLRPIVERQQAINDAKEELKKLAEERKTIAARQEQIRANLGALQSVGQEAGLRNRILSQLESSEDRLGEIDRREAVLNRTMIDTEAEVKALLETVTKE
ncbi:MAG: hypothetical protein U0670_12135 [Anaerolineae bacterium]